ncbi:MAG TPA: serine/threonine-protein kinase [Kofleriaceae bacterium]
MTPCPTDDVLGALVQQVLADDESERVRVHIDECNVCAQAVVAAVKGRAMNPGVAPTLAFGTQTLPTIAPERSEAVIGSKIGRYDVRALLGAGGMGHVYEAYDAELDRAIALKVLRPELGVAQSLTERLVRESRLMAKVSHGSVITVYDVGRAGSTVFIAMELIRGETLGSYVARKRPPWREVVELFERAGAGLAAAHRAGIVHRDFKPENALVELHGDTVSRVVVTDFGIARATSIADDPERGIVGRRSDPRITSVGSAIGTPAYMAPEQLNDAHVDLRADVFAFAASLWEALFGSRPFPGRTVDEIRGAMRRRPQAQKTNVPRAVIRVLERGLAIERTERWQDMTAFVRELLILRSRRRRIQVAAGVMGLVGAGIAGALVLARPSHEDPCARATLALDTTAVRAAIADPVAREAVATKLAGAADTWRKTHEATCKGDRHPVQAPTTTACLDARKLEILGVADDVVIDHGEHALRYLAVLGDAAQCASPAPSQLIAKVPADPALRRKVTALRYRAFTAETARDNAEFKLAIDEATKVVAEAEKTWPFQHAEALYLLGTAQALGGDSKLSVGTLRHAAAVAETAHHDYIAANVWIQLVLSAADDNAPERGLEYANYAEAALDRLGRPPLVTALFEYAKGSTLSLLSRFDEAEISLRRAVDLASNGALATLPQAIQGLGFLYEQQGRYTDAVEAYRLALTKLPENGAGSVSGAIVFRQRLAMNLAMLGRTAEAKAVSREGVAIAESKLPPENVDRATARGNLAEVLLQDGSVEEALVEVQQAMHALAKLEGERSARFGQLLSIKADALHLLERHGEAAVQFARACDIAAFHHGEKSSDHAACELNRAMALVDAGDHATALRVIDKAVPTLLDAFGEPHPQVANALLTRGILRVKAGQSANGIADLERAVKNFEPGTADAGHLANAQWHLAKALWPIDRERAKPILDQALETFKRASLTWVAQHTEAAEWLATNGKPKRR